MNIAVIGPPGSGKGVQCELLSQHTGLPHISIGQLLRAQAKKGTALGKQAARYMKRGELVSAPVATRILRNRLRHKDAGRGAIIDGFPRSIEQAQLLHTTLPLDAVILLRVPDHTIITRLSKRRQCGTCGHIELKSATCTKCGGALIKRADDQARIVRTRLRIYHDTIRPLKTFYKKNGTLHIIDGSRTIPTIHNALTRLLQKLERAHAKSTGVKTPSRKRP